MPYTETLVQAADSFRSRLKAESRESEHQRSFSKELMRELGKAGLIGTELPVTVGGQEAAKKTTGLICEAISRGDINVARLQVVGSLVGHILFSYADRRISDHYLKLITSGQGSVSLGVSEPEAGSDVKGIQSTARRSGNDWVINGTKSMSLALLSDAAVMVSIDTELSENSDKKFTAFLVDLNEAGIERHLIEDHGVLASNRAWVSFDSVKISQDNVVGERGRALSQVLSGFDYSRALIGMQCLGAAQESLEETWTSVSDRHTFGVPLARNQGITFPLADFEAQVAAVRELCIKALDLADQGEANSGLSAMCKLLAPRVARAAIHQCLLFNGQRGYSREQLHEMRLRDVTGSEIGDGTAEMMKLVIARSKIGRT